jgi:hypothetical protein
MWHNYNALLATLSGKNLGASDETLAGAHNIIIRALGGEYLCYYKSQQVLDYYLGSDVVWVQFNLTLTLFEEVGSSGGGGDGGGGGGGGGTQLFFLLSSEDQGFVITEDGKLIPLDLD